MAAEHITNGNGKSVPAQGRIWESSICIWIRLPDLKKIVTEINEREKEAVAKEKRQPVIFEPISPHTLRHSFATRAFEKGMKPKTVQEILGHSSLNMTMDLYTHVTESTKAEEMAVFEKQA